MQRLNFPKFQFRLKKTKDDLTLIFDEIRKKWLQLTPEEWVRQHWISFLTQELGTPNQLIATEVGININTRKKRSDVLVYKDSKVILIIECKRSAVAISQKTLDQILIYNKNYFSKYLVLSNGISHKFFMINYDEKKITELNELPSYIKM
ncbi:MAG: hypothetical protein ACJA0Q_001180 [Saprospiraceae bacterium]|jgi:hypothetical protein